MARSHALVFARPAKTASHGGICRLADLDKGAALFRRFRAVVQRPT